MAEDPGSLLVLFSALDNPQVCIIADDLFCFGKAARILVLRVGNHSRFEFELEVFRRFLFLQSFLDD